MDKERKALGFQPETYGTPSDHPANGSGTQPHSPGDSPIRTTSALDRKAVRSKIGFQIYWKQPSLKSGNRIKKNEGGGGFEGCLKPTVQYGGWTREFLLDIYRGDESIYGW